MLACPQCRAGIPASDVNLQALVGKCAACHHVFRIDPSALDSTASTRAEAPGRPASITFEREEPTLASGDTYRDATSRPRGTFTLRRRWFQPQHVFLLFFCIAWDSFLVFWYGSAFGTDAPWLMIVFPVAHVAVGVGLTYSVIAGFVNRTTLTLTSDALTVHHGPIPWRGNGSFARGEIRGVELTMHTPERSNDSSASGAHAVSLRLADQSLTKLVAGLTDEEARFIQWAVADALRS